MSRRRLVHLALPLGMLLLLALAFWDRLSRVSPVPQTAGSPWTAHGGGMAQANAPGRSPELARGSLLRRELAAGETHEYRIRLQTDFYLQLVVEQRGTDACLVLFSPSGRQLLMVDSPNGTTGPEHLAAVASVSGKYRVEVRGIAASPGGAYDLSVEELRPATDEDRRQAAAVRAFSEAEDLRSLGKAGPLRTAIERYEVALQEWRQIHDLRRQAMTLRRLGQAWYTLGEVRRANRAFQEALPLNRALGDHVTEAKNLNEIGRTFRPLGEPEKAAEAYQRALRLAQETGDRLAEITALNNLGLLCDSLSETQKALVFFDRALAGWRELKDPAREADTLLNLGESYTLLGRPEEAIDLLNRALALKRQVNDCRGQANTLSTLGWARFMTGNLEAALTAYDQSLRLRRETGDQRGEAATLDRRGTVLWKLGKRGEALASYRAALEIFQRVGDRLNEAQVLTSIGWFYEACHQGELALQYFAQSLRWFRQAGDQHGAAYALLGSARASRRLGRLVQAQSQVAEALRIVESVSSEMQRPALKTSYLASRQEYYEFYVQVLMERHAREPGHGWEARALEVSNLARARSLLESLAAAKVDLLARTNPELLAAAQTLEARIRDRERRRIEILGEHSARKETVALERELRSLLLAYDDLQGRIRGAIPRYAALSHPPPLTLRDVQQLLDEDTLLLWYALGDEESFLWVVGPHSLAAYPLAPRTEIEATARRVYELLSQSHKKGLREQAQLAANALSDKVLGPAAGRLGRKRLLIASDGALHYIPFAALTATPAGDSNGKRRPLLIDHEIVQIPSAAVLALVRRELASRPPVPGTLAVVADPVFRRDDPRVLRPLGALASAVRRPAVGVLRAGPATEIERAAREAGLDGFDRLAYAAAEAQAILALVPEPDRFQALGFQANRAMVMSGELGRYRIVHFATHGLLNARHPELSGVVLSLVDEEGRPQDGFLRVQDLVHLTFPAELVVLSACRTALGTEIRGEGLVGLTHAFLVSGAGRVLVSLWNVNDLATAELMGRFYRRLLREKMRPAEALRQAQLSMLQEERWAAPYYWAGFTLHGEWR